MSDAEYNNYLNNCFNLFLNDLKQAYFRGEERTEVSIDETLFKAIEMFLNNKEILRKQGALEELKSKYDDELIKLLFLIRKELNKRHYSNDEIDDRIKELEEGVSK